MMLMAAGRIAKMCPALVVKLRSCTQTSGDMLFCPGATYEIRRGTECVEECRRERTHTERMSFMVRHCQRHHEWVILFKIQNHWQYSLLFYRW